MSLTDRKIEIGLYTIEHGTIAAAEHFDRAPSYCERSARFCKAAAREAAKPVKLKRKSTIVGVIGDTHFPFAHPRYLDFCKDTFEEYGVGKVVHIGDIVDHHAISRHKTEPVADGVLTEFDKAKSMVDEWAKVFPNMIITNGNHDNILERQAAELGVPPVFLKSNHELYQMPKGWELVEQIIIDDVLYKHGIGSGGMHGAYNSAKRNCMSVVQGHTHAFGGVKYISNPNKLWFGMSVGCGIDVDAYAFAYGKHMENRPIIGVGVVRNSKDAVFIPMDMGKYSREG